MTKRTQVTIRSPAGGGYVVSAFGGEEAAFTTLTEALECVTKFFGGAIVVTDAPSVADDEPPVIQREDDGEWIPHTPGQCPVPPDTKIAAVFFRNGAQSTVSPCIAKAWCWKDVGAGTVVAYKVKQ